jgi:hypothetical protein
VYSVFIYDQKQSITQYKLILNPRLLKITATQSALNGKIYQSEVAAHGRKLKYDFL